MQYTPDKFIQKLDEKVISQTDAKRTLAIALRNRWRRTQLDDVISKQITPKNIMLIGSTGVGKTAIVKALADLVDAPMVKVEATKYTQVGYVGENVNEMIEMLAAEGYRRYNKIKQSKYSNKNDYNGFLLVKKANILIKEIDTVIRKELDTLYAEFYSSDIVDVKLEKKETFYQKEDIDAFNKDYLVNDYKLIDWLFNHSLLVELLMVGLNYVPMHLLNSIKSKAKKEKVTRELGQGIDVYFQQNSLLVEFYRLIMDPTIYRFESEKNKSFINEVTFRQIMKDLEEKVDKSFLIYFQSYINYVHHFLDEDPFVYDSSKSEVENDVEEEEDNKESSILKFKDHVKYTENMGIVFIDEIDKLGDNSGASKDNVGKIGVQRDLLSILDGTTVNTAKGPIKTENILFIAAGAFHIAEVSDLMPELLGRLPIQVKLEDMNRNILEKILKNDNLSPVNQYIKLLSVDNIDVKLEDNVLETIARVTDIINRKYQNMGARTLHLVVDRLFAKYAVEVASTDSRKEIKITVADVNAIKKDFATKNFNEMIKHYVEMRSKFKK